MPDEIKPPTNAPTDHHEDGPSNHPAWALCACYDGEKDIEDADADALAIETTAKADTSPKGRGTAQHLALAKVIRGQPGAFSDLSEVEENQVRWVAESTIEAAANAGYSPSEIHVEERMTMFKGDSFEVLYFGTVDIHYGPFLFDAKFGDVRNYFAQLCAYALPKMEAEGRERIFARLQYGRWKKVVSHVIDRETAERVVYSILAKRHNPHRQPTPCDYCSWCLHRSTCSAINVTVDTLLGKRPDWALRLPSLHVSDAANDPALIGAMYWLWKTRIEPWGSGLEYSARLMAEYGTTPLGFTKRPEKGRLGINDPTKAFQALQEAGISQEHILSAASYSIKSLAAAYVLQFGGSEATAAKKIEAILTASGAAQRGDSVCKLIRNSDAEDDIRATLARPVSGLPLQLADHVTNPQSEQAQTTTT
jgi:hypothetical protein